MVFWREKWENRQNWYGVPIKVRSPASNKKAAGNAARKKGDERVEGAGLASETTLFRQSSVPWASFTNCQKKEGP